jgi:O-antigen ligase
MYSAKGLSLVTYLLYLALLVSLILSFRAVSSICIPLLIVIGFLQNKSEGAGNFHQRLKTPFFLGCCLLFMIHVISLAWTENSEFGLGYIRLTSGLLFTPLVICCSGFIDAKSRQNIFTGYILALTMAAIYCLGMATVHYFQTGRYSSFFYHSLVKPVKQHAVYFSVLIFIGQVWLLNNSSVPSSPFVRKIRIGLLLFLSGFLFLLSSKLILVIYLVYLLNVFYFFIKTEKVNRGWLTISFTALILFSGLLLVVKNPVSERFYDILEGDPGVVQQEKFETKDYFNGLQFRLLQYKFTGQILSEQNSWLLGVGPGDAKDLLDQKYISTRMYTGDPAVGTTGFLGYNSHNQFLETTLQSGILGLAVLIFICSSLLKMAVTHKNRTFRIVVIMLLAWLFTESVFETQFGILIFTFFPLLLYFD